mgnify:CR=1 FL=1
MAKTTQTFKQVQSHFAKVIVDPTINCPDGIEPRRLKIYQELFYNNIESFIANGFPVLKKVVSDTYWHEMIRGFMLTHHNKTPLFHKIAEEFLDYLNNERKPDLELPVIRQLAHYEWVELALSVLDEGFIETMFTDSDVLSTAYQLSPLAQQHTYEYEVHQIKEEGDLTETPLQPFYVLIYRNKGDSVTFVELNVVSVALLDFIKEGLTGEEAVEQLSKILTGTDRSILMMSAKAIIGDWLGKGILI